MAIIYKKLKLFSNHLLGSNFGYLSDDDDDDDLQSTCSESKLTIDENSNQFQLQFSNSNKEISKKINKKE